MSSSIILKMLALVALPLAFQALFICLLVWGHRAQEAAFVIEIRSRQVMVELNELLRFLVDAETGIRGFVIADDSDFLEPYEVARREVPIRLERLREFGHEGLVSESLLYRVDDSARRSMDWLTRVKSAMASGNSVEAGRELKTSEGRRLMDRLRDSVDELLLQEGRIVDERARKLEEMHFLINVSLWGSGAVVVLTAGMAVLFSRRLSRRIDVLMSNTKRLSLGQELLAPLGGRDEITQFDRAFHHMAQQLRLSEQKIRQAVVDSRDLFNQAPCCYMSLGVDGAIVEINETGLKWLQYERHEVVGCLRYSDLLTEAGREAFVVNFERFKKEGSISNASYDLIRKDGSLLPVIVNLVAVYDASGSYLYSRATLFDATKQRQDAAEILKLNADLEKRVSRRTHDLEEANRELSQKNRENEMFVYSVTHDLRSPLVNLQGFSREMEKACAELKLIMSDPRIPVELHGRSTRVIEGKIDRSLEFIRTAVQRLTTIIDALLRLSRTGRVEYSWQRVDVDRVVSHILNSMQNILSERNVRVQKSELDAIWADPTSIEQVFSNLLTNAVNYLDPNRPGQIDVGCQTAEDATGRRFTTFYVRDNGLGIAPAHHAKIFQAFQRLHAGASEGEGIGLTVVSRVVERHRGRIWVESEEGLGSTFYVSVPTDGSIVRANPLAEGLSRY